MQFRCVSKALALLFVAHISMPKLVHAGGYEYPAAGTRSLGRGGAFNARTDDPMVLHYNPAGLAHIDGMQIGVQSNFAFLDACATRFGTYSDNVGFEDQTTLTRFGSSTVSPPAGYNAVPFPKVCNSGPVGISPQISFSWRIQDKLGIGIGIFTPNTVGAVTFGDNDGTVPVNGVDAGALPNPLRYDIIKQRVILFYPTIGVGYSLS